VKENFDECFKLIIQDEGGYVNDPRDPGGRTNLGVTQRNWEAYLNRSVTETEMRRLMAEDVRTFYKIRYWDKIRGDDLPAGVDYAVFDLAVNSGVSKASMTLQSLVGAFADGKIGPKTLNAVANADAPKLIASICDMRRDFLRGLSTFAVYGKGWLRRVANVESRARDMA
jgi:lysozyme family protein